MVIFVITLNVIISVICFGIVGYLWQLRKTLANVADTVSQVEQNCYSTLHGSPKYILLGQQSTSQFRKQYDRLGKRLEQQLDQLQRLVALINTSRGLWGHSRKFYSRRRLR